MQSPTVRRISFTFPDEQVSPRFNSKGSNRSAGSAFNSSGGIISVDRNSAGSAASGSTGSFSNHHQPLLGQDQPQARIPKELTCISEEGIIEPHGPV